jgi:hypothetical protein
MQVRLIVAGILLFCLIQNAGSEEDGPASFLVSEDEQSRDATFRQLIQDRKVLIHALIATLDDPKKHSNQDGIEKTIELLGVLRAEEASRVLAANIGYPWVRHRATKFSIEPPSGVGAYARNITKDLPAVRALVRIGDVCVDDVINELFTTDKQFVRDACEVVLQELSKRETLQSKLDGAASKADTNGNWAVQQALKRIMGNPPKK